MNVLGGCMIGGGIGWIDDWVGMAAGWVSMLAGWLIGYTSVRHISEQSDLMCLPTCGRRVVSQWANNIFSDTLTVAQDKSLCYQF